MKNKNFYALVESRLPRVQPLYEDAPKPPRVFGPPPPLREAK